MKEQKRQAISLFSGAGGMDIGVRDAGFNILAEIELGDEELPIEYFLLRRFAFTEENLLKLLELIKNCTETDFSLTELLEQTQLQEA